MVTVAAGRPPPHALTDWDRRCGFTEADDVVGARRAEDLAAVEQLGARPVWLDFLDRQYMGGEPPSVVSVAQAIEAVLRERAPDLVASPLGLSHPDHVVTAAACFDVAARMRNIEWVVYEDAIYRATGGVMEQAMSRLEGKGFALQPLDVASTTRKHDAVFHYTSQLKGLADLLDDATRPERYWKLSARP